ncbi:MAG: hypothetical protein FJ096_09115 [Deltaproteobacteria bacterium]|nr:hypothetical protein [Deltaproteobacteria bacterium]
MKGQPRRTVLEESSIVEGVQTSGSFELYFDRFLWPKTVSRQAVCLHPSSQTVTRFDECVEPAQPFTQPAYNPVRRAVSYRLPPGARLAPATQYRLTVFPAVADGEPGFLAFDGAPLARSYAFDFRTSAETATAIDEPSPSAERYCQAMTCAKACAVEEKACKSACKKACASDADPDACESPCLAGCQQSGAACREPCGCLDGPACVGDGDLIGDKPLIFRACGFAPCHSARVDPTPDFAAVPPLGLDLSSPGALAATALGVTAHLSQHGEAATESDPSGARFGRAMPIIDPANPGNSFLVYKLLINGRNFGDIELGTSLESEIDRLRAGAIAGIPMPGPNGPDTNRLELDGETSQRQLQLISDWIAAGAVLSCE